MEIVTLRPSQNKDAIEILEETLERAKNGEITAVSLSWITSNGTIDGANSSGKDQLLMLVSIENTLWSFKRMVFKDE